MEISKAFSLPHSGQFYKIDVLRRGIIKSRGFTLLEILVTIAVLATTGAATAAIFFTSLRGASKADILQEVRSNGDYALNIMERMIRNSTAITSTCNGTNQTSITINNPDSGTTVFDFLGTQIASNASSFLTTAKVTLTGTNYFNCSQVAGKPPLVKIYFNLSQTGLPVGPEGLASATFQTTVSLRTY